MKRWQIGMSSASYTLVVNNIWLFPANLWCVIKKKKKELVLCMHHNNVYSGNVIKLAAFTLLSFQRGNFITSLPTLPPL